MRGSSRRKGSIVKQSGDSRTIRTGKCSIDLATKKSFVLPWRLFHSSVREAAWWCIGVCVTTSFWDGVEKRKKPWYVVFAHFHGVNTSNMTDLKHQIEVTKCSLRGNVYGTFWEPVLVGSRMTEATWPQQSLQSGQKLKQVWADSQSFKFIHFLYH